MGRLEPVTTDPVQRVPVRISKGGPFRVDHAYPLGVERSGVRDTVT